MQVKVTPLNKKSKSDRNLGRKKRQQTKNCEAEEGKNDDNIVFACACVACCLRLLYGRNTLAR